jgi:hypothetical protein
VLVHTNTLPIAVLPVSRPSQSQPSYRSRGGAKRIPSHRRVGRRAARTSAASPAGASLAACSILRADFSAPGVPRHIGPEAEVTGLVAGPGQPGAAGGALALDHLHCTAAGGRPCCLAPGPGCE